MINIILSLLTVHIFGQLDLVRAEPQLRVETKAEEQHKRPELIKGAPQESRSIGVKITAASALVVDVATGKILYSKNIYRRQPMASITKLATALVFLEHNPGWNKKITFLEKDKREGSRDLFYVGEKAKVRDFFRAGLMMSNNSAIAALIRSTGLSEKEFVDLMNKKAKELDLNNTNFADPTGFDTGNISTAVDVIKLARQAFKNENIRNATTLGRYTVKVLNTGRIFYIFNTDQLLGSFLDKGNYKVVAGKTGYLDEAGYNFVTQIKNSAGGEVLSVVLDSSSLTGRFDETKGIVSWVFKHYRW